MTISLLSSASAESDAITIPAHVAGDLLVICALRTTSNANPTLPSAWINSGNNAGLNNDNLVVGYCVAADAASTSGTWTGAEFMLAMVWRPTTYVHILERRNGARSTAGAGTSTPIFAQKAIRTTNTVPSSESARMAGDSSIVLGIISSPSTAVSLSPAPSGMTNLVTASGASSRQIAVHGTSSAVSAWASTNATLSGATPWITAVVEIVATGLRTAAGGGVRLPNIRGGADQ